MEFQGKITMVMPVRSGIAKTSGKEWQSQDYMLEWVEGEGVRKVLFHLFGSNNIASYNIQAGDKVSVDLAFDAREWQGKYFNSVTCTSCHKLDGETPLNDNMDFQGPGSAVSDSSEDLPF